MKTEKIRGHEQASVKVLKYENGREELVSYSTTVVVIDEQSWISVNGLYSRTTIKHIGWFMKEHGFNYYTAKNLYNNNWSMNKYTGEIKERS